MVRFTTAFSFFILFLAFGVNAALAQSAGPPVLRGASSPTTGRSNITNVGANQINNSTPALITIPTVVMDRNGRYVANLRKEDFKIFDNGVEQQVAYFAPIEKPFTVALMLDVSGSTQYQLAQIREAADTFVGRLRSNDRLTAITFDGKINLLSDAIDVNTIRRSGLRIPAVTDGTALYDAVDFALKRMAGIQGRKAIVLMTDGVDQSSKLATMLSTLKAIVEQDVIVYTVQYNTLPQLPQRLSFIKNEKARRKVQDRLMKGYAVSEPYLRGLADKTGGRFYKADDLRDVAPAFAAITAELGVQYSLGYYPKDNSQGSAERAIKVRVRYPNLVVRARESYATSQTIAKQQ
jgi:Ca-activated chloride channel family protein